MYISPNTHGLLLRGAGRAINLDHIVVFNVGRICLGQLGDLVERNLRNFGGESFDQCYSRVSPGSILPWALNKGPSIQYSCVIIPPSFLISAIALSMMDAGVLSGKDTTTGFCGGGRANTAVNKAMRRMNRRMLVESLLSLEC
jgi:hypothetical protein